MKELSLKKIKFVFCILLLLFFVGCNNEYDTPANTPTNNSTNTPTTNPTPPTNSRSIELGNNSFTINNVSSITSETSDGNYFVIDYQGSEEVTIDIALADNSEADENDVSFDKVLVLRPSGSNRFFFQVLMDKIFEPAEKVYLKFTSNSTDYEILFLTIDADNPKDVIFNTRGVELVEGTRSDIVIQSSHTFARRQVIYLYLNPPVTNLDVEIPRNFDFLQNRDDATFEIKAKLDAEPEDAEPVFLEFLLLDATTELKVATIVDRVRGREAIRGVITPITFAVGTTERMQLSGGGDGTWSIRSAQTSIVSAIVDTTGLATLEAQGVGKTFIYIDRTGGVDYLDANATIFVNIIKGNEAISGANSPITLDFGATRKTQLSGGGDGNWGVTNHQENIVSAAIDTNGAVTLTARGVGTATIDIHRRGGTNYEDASKPIVVHVTRGSEAISGANSPINLTLDATSGIQLSGGGDGAWSITNNQAGIVSAAIDTNGAVTLAARGVGETTIHIHKKGGTHYLDASTSIAVRVTRRSEAIRGADSMVTVFYGENKEIQFSGGGDGTWRITSSQENIVSVFISRSGGAILMPKSLGDATVTVEKYISSNYPVDSTTITVSVIQGREAISGANSPITLTFGTTRAIALSGGGDGDWRLDNQKPAIISAQINSEGGVTLIPNKVGEAKIIVERTGSSNYLDASTSIAVNVTRGSEAISGANGPVTLILGTNKIISLSRGGDGIWEVTSNQKNIASATVDTNGMVTLAARGAGEATIQVHRKGGTNYLDASTSIAVNVIRGSEAISGADSTVTLFSGTLRVIEFSGGGDGDWSIINSNENILTADIGTSGAVMLMPKAVGIGTISIYRRGGSNYFDASTSVAYQIFEESEAISGADSTITLPYGKNKKIQFSGGGAGAWNIISNDRSIVLATINLSGVATLMPEGLGKTTITVTKNKLGNSPINSTTTDIPSSSPINSTTTDIPSSSPVDSTATGIQDNPNLIPSGEATTTITKYRQNDDLVDSTTIAVHVIKGSEAISGANGLFTLDFGATRTIQLGGGGDGAWSITNNQTSIVSAAIDTNGMVTLAAQGAGTTTINVHKKGGTYYLDASTTIAVQVFEESESIIGVDSTVTLSYGKNKEIQFRGGKNGIWRITSGKENIVSVSIYQSGLATFIPQGIGDVTVAVEKYDNNNLVDSTTIAVSVIKGSTAISGGDSTVTFSYGATRTLTFSGGGDGTWRIKDSEQTQVSADISENGRVTLIAREVGETIITIEKVGGTHYLDATTSIAIKVNKASQNLLAPSATLVFGGVERNISVSGGRGNGFWDATTNNTNIVKIEINAYSGVLKITPISAGKATVDIFKEGNDHYLADKTSIKVTVLKVSQNISLSQTNFDFNLGDAPITATINENSNSVGDWIVVSSNSSVATIIASGDSLTITPLAVGTITADIQKKGDNNYRDSDIIRIAVLVREGNSISPYTVATASQLQAIGRDTASLSAHYTQTANIDLSSIANFTPIGNSVNPFKGSFNGNGFKITGLKIEKSNSDYIGLFGYVGSDDADATLENITLENVFIIGKNNVGGLAGLNYGNITASHSSGSVQGSYQTGGLVGNNKKDITASHSSGSVSGGDITGGLIGNNEGVVTNSYSSNSITGQNIAGGLIGTNTGIIRSGYAIGSVQNSTSFGGLAGYNTGTVQNSYWNSETSGHTVAGLNVDATSWTSRQMLESTSLAGFGDSWDFGDNQSYPVLTSGGASKTDQLLYQVFGMLRLTSEGELLGNTNIQETLNNISNPNPDATVFVLDVNARADNHSSRVDFWSCTAGTGDVLLTTNSVGGTSVQLRFASRTTDKSDWIKKSGNSCAVMLNPTGAVAAGDKLDLEAVISKGSGTAKKSLIRKFFITFIGEDTKMSVPIVGIDSTVTLALDIIHRVTLGGGGDGVWGMMSEDTSIVSGDISPTGIVTLNPKALGSTSIHIYKKGGTNYLDATASVNIVVEKKPQNLTANNVIATFGQSSTIMVSGGMGNGLWSASSANENIATVSMDSKTGSLTITPKSAGNVKITVSKESSARYKRGTTTFSVMVNRAREVISGAENQVLSSGSDRTVDFSGGGNGNWSASSDNENVATVKISDKGVVKISAVGIGTPAMITITRGKTPQYQKAVVTFQVFVRNGSLNFPYTIANAAQLQAIGNDATSLSAHYTQIADIDLSFISNFDPIGSGTPDNFRGAFNGNGFKITGLRIDRDSSNAIGLFGSIDKATLNKIILENVQINGNAYVGGLVGNNILGTITGSSVSGVVIGKQRVGGLVGSSSYRSIIGNSHSTASVILNGNFAYAGGLIGYNQGFITNSFASGSVKASANYIGGLVGSSVGGWIQNSYSSGPVQGGGYVGGLAGSIQDNNIIDSYSSSFVEAEKNLIGGLVGYSNNSNIAESYATGSVLGENAVGGLVGRLNTGTIINSYSIGSVQGNGGVGGLVGSNSHNIIGSHSSSSVFGNQNIGGLIGVNAGSVSSSYAIGSVRGKNIVGGLLGNNRGTITNSYWNNETSGQTSEGTSSAKTSRQILESSTLTGFDASWDFGDLVSYPVLVNSKASSTEQLLHQAAGIIRLANATGDNFLKNTNLQYDITMDKNSVHSNSSAFFVFDVNAEAANHSSRVDSWDCAAGSGDVLLTTNSVGGTSVELRFGAKTSNKLAWHKKSGSSCGVVRNNTIAVSTGEKLELEAVISKGIGVSKRSFTRKFSITFIDSDGEKIKELISGAENQVSLSYGTSKTIQFGGGGDGRWYANSDNENIAIANINQSGTVTLISRGAGTTKVTIERAESRHYLADSTTIAVEVLKASESISGANTVQLSYNTTKTIQLSGGGDGAWSIAGGNENLVSADIDQSGVVTLTAKEVGTTTMNILKTGGKNYIDASATITINIGKAKQNLLANSIIIPTGSPSVIIVSGGMGTGNWSTNSDASSIASVSINSSGQLTITPKALGKAKVYIRKDGDNHYLAGSTNITVTVKRISQTIHISKKDFYFKTGASSTTAFLGGGTRSTGGWLITNNNSSVATTTISNNVLTITPLAAGNITADIQKEGDNSYEDSNIIRVNILVRNGTSLFPYNISTASELQAIQNNLNAHYTQIADIDLSSIPNFNPIGTYIGYNNPNNRFFTGGFNGNGYKITGLKINKPRGEAIGLFGYIQNASLENITLQNVLVQGNNTVGGLVGYSFNSTIKSSSVNGIVTGVNKTSSHSIGGLVGENTKGSIIENSHSSVTVDAFEYIGGLAGQNKGQIIGSSVRGYVTVSGDHFVGGLVGGSEGGIITNSYAHSNVRTASGKSYNGFAGGLVGIITENSSIEGSYSNGSVIGYRGIGGLVGYVDTNSTITNSYTTSFVQGSERATGGLVGTILGGSIENSYASGIVQGNRHVGGLLGYTMSSTIRNSYASGSVQGKREVAGFTGYSDANTISSSYATGSVRGNIFVYGLLAYIRGDSTTTNFYWNSETSGQSSSNNQNTSSNYKPLNSQQFLTTNLAGFGSAWNFGDNLSYPLLANNIASITEQQIHQAAAILRLANPTGDDFLKGTNWQQDITLDTSFITSNHDTVFVFDVNAMASNNSTRVDFWDCAAGTGDVLLTTNSVNGTKVELRFGAGTTEKRDWQKASGTSCEVVRSDRAIISAGDKLEMQAVISKGTGANKKSVTRNFSITFTGRSIGKLPMHIISSEGNITIPYGGKKIVTFIGRSTLSHWIMTSSNNNIVAGDISPYSENYNAYVEFEAQQVGVTEITVRVPENAQYLEGSITFTVEVVKQTQTLSANSITVPAGSDATHISVIGGKVDGAWSASSDNENVATVSISNTGRLTITPKAGGRTKINIHNAGNSNYSAASTSIFVTLTARIQTISISKRNFHLNAGGSSTTASVSGDSKGAWLITNNHSLVATTTITNNVLTITPLAAGNITADIQKRGDKDHLDSNSIRITILVGNGTPSFPYATSSVSEIQAIDNDATSMASHYIQTGNIDLSSITNFHSIGAVYGGHTRTAFTGSFDGNGYKITGIKMDVAPHDVCIGFFALTRNAVLKNINLENIYIDRSFSESDGGIGGLVGEAVNSTITGSSVSGSIKETIRPSGGLACKITGTSIIENSYSAVNIEVKGGYAGGLVGENHATIIGSFFIGNITSTPTLIGNQRTGGLVGYNTGTIRNSFSVGTVEGSSGQNVGGLVGENTGQIINNYSFAHTKGSSNVGGLIGYNTSATMRNNYSTGFVSGSGNALVGTDSGVSTNNYWNSETSRKNNGGTGTTSRTNLQMLQGTSSDNFSGFDDVWNFGDNSNYPILLRNRASTTDQYLYQAFSMLRLSVANDFLDGKIAQESVNANIVSYNETLFELDVNSEASNSSSRDDFWDCAAGTGDILLTTQSVNHTKVQLRFSSGTDDKTAWQKAGGTSCAVVRSNTGTVSSGDKLNLEAIITKGDKSVTKSFSITFR